MNQKDVDRISFGIFTSNTKKERKQLRKIDFDDMLCFVLPVVYKPARFVKAMAGKSFSIY